MLSNEEKEIFNNLKEYMQSNIDKGYHKFIYNDLDWDFKCIDCINVIDKVLKQQKEIEELKNADLTTVYLNGVYDGEKKAKDKIKAKIEELEKEQEDNRKDLYNAINNLCFKEIDKISDRIYVNMSIRDILRSLLEKE